MTNPVKETDAQEAARKAAASKAFDDQKAKDKAAGKETLPQVLDDVKEKLGG
jgi:hypothetical protein